VKYPKQCHAFIVLIKGAAPPAAIQWFANYNLDEV
jgi:hypothetical protein